MTHSPCGLSFMWTPFMWRSRWTFWPNRLSQRWHENGRSLVWTNLTCLSSSAFGDLIFSIVKSLTYPMAAQDKHGTLERNERLSPCHLPHDKRFGKSPFCEVNVTNTYSDGKPTQNISPQLTKWPFLHVHTGHVDFKVDLLSKSLVAEVARVRSLFKVHRPHMFVQHCLWGCYSLFSLQLIPLMQCHIYW